MAGARDKGRKIIRDEMKKALGNTKELTDAQKKQRQEGEKYVKTLINKADALKLENKLLKEGKKVTEEDIKAKMIALDIQNRIKQQTLDDLNITGRKQKMDALGLKLMTQIKKEDESALIAKQQLKEEEQQRLIAQQTALDLEKQEEEAIKKATIAKQKAKFIEEQRKILIKEETNLRKQSEAARAKELADLKKAIIDRHSQVSILHRLLGIKKKLFKIDVLNVRNQRNLGGSLSVIRSKLLIASFGFGLLTRSVNGLIGEYAKYQAAQTRVDAALKSTGFTSRQSVQGLSQLASEIQNTTGVSDTLTLSSSALLTTFTQISGETFPIAQKAIIDMTAAMNAGQVTQEGLKSSTIQVGKALNDPIRGLTSLSRVGVAFTQQQKEQIETLVNSGKASEAQAIILKELNKEFGNIASADSYEKSLRQLDSAFGDLQKEIGVALLPELESLVGWLAKLAKNLDTKDLYEFIVALGSATISIMTMRKWMMVMNVEMALGVTRIGAISKAFRTLASSSGVGIAIVGLGLLIERSLEFLGVFDDVGSRVDNVTSKFRDMNNINVTMMLGMDKMTVPITATKKGLEELDKVINMQGTSISNLYIEQLRLEKSIKTLGVNSSSVVMGQQEEVKAIKAKIVEILNNVASQEKLREQLEAFISTEETVSTTVEDITKKYKNQKDVLNAVGNVNKELVKVSQDLFDGNQDLIAALDDETHQYHELAKAIEEVITKKKEQTDAIAMYDAIQATSVAFFQEGINSQMAAMEEKRQSDIEDIKQTSAYKIAQKRGDNAKMKELEKQASKETLGERVKLFRMNQSLAVASITFDYLQAIAKEFGMKGLLGGAFASPFLLGKLAADIAIVYAQKPPTFAQGGDFITAGPQNIIVGDNPGGRERVQVTPLSSPNVAGPQGGGGTNITLNVSAPLVDDTVVDTIIPAIREALRRGENLDHRHGHSGSAGWTSPPDWE